MVRGMLIKWCHIRLIGELLGFDMSSVVFPNCCVACGLFMGVSSRGRGVLVTGVCGRDFWIVVVGGVMNGTFSLYFV